VARTPIGVRATSVFLVLAIGSRHARRMTRDR
jgi:hypothetical protein